MQLKGLSVSNLVNFNISFKHKHLSYGRICRGQVFVYLLQVWLSGFIGKALVKVILESEFS